MGRLSLQVTAVRGAQVDLRIVAEEDIDGLGVDRLEIAATATFTGAGGRTEGPAATVCDFPDTGGTRSGRKGSPEVNYRPSCL